MNLPTHQIKTALHRLLPIAVAIFGFQTMAPANDSEFSLSVKQITFGLEHHFFGYIGQSKTIPWNASGRYIVAMRNHFHDRLPGPEDAVDIILIDTEENYRITQLDQSRGWNLQQGTMLYWNPLQPETQFFFNDRNPDSGRVFTALYDISKHQRIHEYRYPNDSIGNLTDIHPKNKQEVGRRLALWALANDYNFDTAFSGPIFSRSIVKSKKIHLRFDHALKGLKTNDGIAPRHFEIAGKDRVFHPVTAIITGKQIIVSQKTFPILRPFVMHSQATLNQT